MVIPNSTVLRAGTLDHIQQM